MATSTANYWRERSIMQMDRGMLAADKAAAELDKAYRKAMREIQADINGLYAKYGDQYGLTYLEAAKAIDASDFIEWRMSVGDYVERIAQTGDDMLQLELDTLATRARVSRLEAVNTAIKVNIAELQAKEAELVKQLLTDTYNESFYHQVFDIQQGVGFGQTFEMLQPAQVTKALAYPWSGATFSDRIWLDKQLLSAKLQETLTQSLTQGRSIRAMTQELQKAMNAGRYVSERLIRTETAYAVEQGTLQGYREMEIEEYEILATLDNRTSEICQKQDGKTYKVADAVVGKTYPPFHAQCRTTTVPRFGEEYDAGTRTARGRDGKLYEVPSTLKYPEWYETYVKAA